MNHLKSKGSGCGANDDDTTTGQGNCNLTRTLAAQELAAWLETDPTESGDGDVLIIGDLNSYAKEDPIAALEEAGYTDLVNAFGGEEAYGYVFDGQLGYLDHALATASAAAQVAGVAEWHINADEIPLFDYNDDARTADEAAFEEESDVLPLYEPDAFRTSDHDPILIGLDLAAPPAITSLTLPTAPVVKGSPVSLRATFTDINAGDTHDASIDWGDGTVQAVDPRDEPDRAHRAHVRHGRHLRRDPHRDRLDRAVGRRDVRARDRVRPERRLRHRRRHDLQPRGRARGASPDAAGPATFDLSAKLAKGSPIPKGTATLRVRCGRLRLRRDGV